MSENSKIEWTDHTFNPWEGCQKVGPGCDHCYAENRNARFSGGVAVNWGPGAPRRRTSAANWRKPLAWNENAAAFKAEHGRRQRVFCASLADVFDNQVDPAWRYDLFNLILSTPGLDWLLLTKRIGNVAQMIEDTLPASMKALPPDCPVAWPWPNVWLGATIVNQEEADRDIPKLLATPARVRFLSMEPLLGPVTLPGFNANTSWCPICKAIVPDSLMEMHESTHGVEIGASYDPTVHCSGVDSKLNWVIAGGESGPGARPMHPDWARSLRDQCTYVGVPFMFKQWGEWLPINQQKEEFTNRLYKSNRIAALHEDQGNLDDCYGRRCTVANTVVHIDGSTHSITEPMAFLQGADAMTTFKVGKKAAGRLLNGMTHDGFPKSQL